MFKKKATNNCTRFGHSLRSAISCQRVYVHSNNRNSNDRRSTVPNVINEIFRCVSFRRKEQSPVTFNSTPGFVASLAASYAKQRANARLTINYASRIIWYRKQRCRRDKATWLNHADSWFTVYIAHTSRARQHKRWAYTREDTRVYVRIYGQQITAPVKVGTVLRRSLPSTARKRERRKERERERQKAGWLQPQNRFRPVKRRPFSIWPFHRGVKSREKWRGCNKLSRIRYVRKRKRRESLWIKIVCKKKKEVDRL